MRRSLLVTASLLLAALGTALVWLYVQGADNRATSQSEVVTVYKVGRNVAQGTTIRAADLLPARVAASEVGDKVVDPGVAAGKTATTLIPAGTILQTGMFSEGQVGPVTDGNVGVSVTITDPHRVPALLQPNQEVAVYVVPNNGGGNTASLVVARARVSAVGAATSTPQAAQQQGGANGAAAAPAQIVTFDVEPADGVRIASIELRGQPLLMVLGKGARPAPSVSASAVAGASSR